MAVIRLFAQAREAAGVASDTFDATSVDQVLVDAAERYGSDFAAVLGTCRVWVNGEPAADGAVVGADDEVAVLPPVSGG